MINDDDVVIEYRDLQGRLHNVTGSAVVFDGNKFSYLRYGEEHRVNSAIIQGEFCELALGVFKINVKYPPYSGGLIV